MTSASSFNYQAGGSLPADAPSYVERQCDRDYYDLLKDRKYCYVFNCRQMGKSSLRVRVTHKLQAEGIVCATIDPQKIGVEVTCEQWYASAIRSLVGDLDLKNKFDLRNWIRERELLSPVQRFAEFIETVVLQEIAVPIVIFVEEIDRLLSLKFGMDDFFGLVRSFFEDRPTKPDYNRLTFSFLGVATPTDLIQSHSTSAFNIGYAVEMSGFTLSEATPLMRGLIDKVNNPQDYLVVAVKLTGGQPFLLQRVLDLIEKESVGVDHLSPELIGSWIKSLVQKRIVINWEAQDTPPHLTTIRDRVLSVEEKLRGRMLGCYQQILKVGALEDDRSEERTKLRLTGLVVRRKGYLQSYNPIYAAVFNKYWIEQRLGDLRPTFYAEAFRAWSEAELDQNQGFLLRGQALIDAEAWARGKRISEQDEQFLRESLEKERVENNRKFELERQQREAAQESNRLLLAAEKKSSQSIRVTIGIFLTSFLVPTGIVLLWATLYVTQTTNQATNKAINQSYLLGEIMQISTYAKILFKENRLSEESLYQSLKASDKLRNILDSQSLSLSDEQKNDINIYVTSSLFQSIPNDQKSKRISVGEDFTKVSFINNSTFITTSPTKSTRFWGLDGTVIPSQQYSSNKYENQSVSKTNKISVTLIEDNTIKVIRSEGDKTVKLQDDNYRINSVDISPDGRIIATGSVVDGNVKLWNLDGKPLKNLMGHRNSVLSVAFSYDSKMLATGSQDTTVKLWTIDGVELQSLQGHKDGVTSLAFSPDGKMLASASKDKTVILWDVRFRDLDSSIRKGCEVINTKKQSITIPTDVLKICPK